MKKSEQSLRYSDFVIPDMSAAADMSGIQKILMPQADPPVAEKLDSHLHGNDRKKTY